MVWMNEIKRQLNLVFILENKFGEKISFQNDEPKLNCVNKVVDEGHKD